MEHKSWPWKKKSSEKLMIAADKVNRGNEDEAKLADKVDLERNLRILDEKLSAALGEINTKDEIAKKQTNIAREAIQGWEKAEMEVLALKQELEKVTRQNVADGERLHGADAALKECMVQLRFVREEQEKRIQDAVDNTSKEFDKRISILEEKLAESNKIISKLSLENMQLDTTVSVKEKMIDELQSVRGQLDYDLRAVVSQLESTQREHSSLSYEVRVLEKELEIRNEEREFNRRTSEVAHKQYLGSVKKIAKLEAETQRLRLLVQKRLPGPADVAKMKNATAVTRRRSNPFPMVTMDYIVDDASSKKIAFLTEQLCSFEEENRLLKEFLNQKTSELSKSQTSEMGSDEKVSMAESWAPSCYTAGASDIGLMDDFVEMEKLALVSVEKPSANSSLVQENHIHWLDNILKVVAEHANLMQRSSTDMLDDIKVALAGRNKCDFGMPVDMIDANGDISDENMNKSIQKLVELIKGIRLSDKDDGLSPFKASETPTGYTVHIFQWKTSELRAILGEFLQVCNKLVNGKVDLDDFVKELTSAMEWIVNHCFSLQDVSSMKDEIKKHFEWDETRSESEIEGGTIGHLSEVDKLTFPKDQLPGWPMASSCIKNKSFHLEPNVKEEVRNLKDDIAKLESADKDLECKLQKESDKCASPTVQLQESEKAIGTLKDQTEADIMVKDLDKYLISTVDKCNESHQEPTAIKDQDISTSSDEKLDSTNIQPESMTGKDLKGCDIDGDTLTIPSEHAITSSEKLAECQETISNLGKQLKAMASLPIQTSVSDSSEITVSTLTDENNNQKISLLDKMITEDAAGAPRSQKTKGVSRTLTSPAILDGNSNPVTVMSPRMFVSVEGVKDEKDEEALVNFLSIVPNKKKTGGGGILKRLFWKKKKCNNK
uniref:filament-like plant protein 7 n=1 Tax=Erigeron canadensis TaxID=72917 RepID=UPI001CB971BD|nr:filament-like plant protein 7 [Erigeron canadensis]XP_043634367.1 filament-like plant protein 7 [Erigeron canadensis]